MGIDYLHENILIDMIDTMTYEILLVSSSIKI